MNIQQTMTSPAITCLDGDPLNVPAGLMWEHDCGAIPVTDNQGQLVGIITDRDICMATYTRGSAPAAIRVADVMSRHVFSCHSSDSLEAAEQVMRNNQVRRLPVVDDKNRPVGLLSMNDLARQVTSSRKGNSGGKGVVETLAAISQPRRTALARSERHSAAS